MKNKKISRALCALLAVLTAFSFSGCDELLDEILNELIPSPSFSASTDGETDDGESAEESGDESSENPENSEAGENSETPENPENSESGENSGTTESPETVPTPNEPDETKTVASEEIDSIGHKIVYYTDGTWEDLGRAVALKTASPAPETQYGYQYFYGLENGEGLCGFYTCLYDTYTGFHNGNEDVSANESGNYEVANVNFANYGISAEQAISVWKIFLAENPQRV